MSSPMIDLGEIREPPPETPTTESTRARRRRTVAAAVAVASLAVATGSAPVPSLLVEVGVPSAIGESMEVDDDLLLLVRPHVNQAVDGERTITAYTLPEARRIWQVRVRSEGRAYQGLFRAGDLLVMPRYEEDTGNAEVTTLDARSGRLRWRRPGNLIGVANGSGEHKPVLLFGSARADRPFGAPETVTAVDVDTGRPVWSYRSPRGALMLSAWLPVSSAMSRLVVGLPSGRIEVRDAVTGRRIASVESGPPPPPEPLTPHQPPWLSVLDDIVLVPGDGGRTVTAYGLDRLERLWTAPWSNVRWYGWADCGDLLCVTTPDARVRAVEPDTGRTRWVDTFPYLAAVGPLLLVTRHEGGDVGSPKPMELVDPATARTVRELGTWGLATRSPGGDSILISQSPDRRAWFAVVDPAARDVRLLGVAHDVIGNCQVGRDSVVCRRRDATIGVWRYR